MKISVVEVIYPSLLLLLGTFIIYGVHLYISYKKNYYLYATVFSANMLIYIIYKMFELKYSIIIVSLFGKILPMALLAFIDIFIMKDTLSLMKKIGLVLVMVGAVLLL